MLFLFFFKQPYFIDVEVREDNKVEIEELVAKMQFSSLNGAITSSTAAASAPQKFDFTKVEDLLEEVRDYDADDHSNDSAQLSLPGPHELGFSVPHIPYVYLSRITEDFGRTGADRRIGSGGFSDVFLGITFNSGKKLAVKRLKCSDTDSAVSQLSTEVGEMTRLRHKYLIEVKGYSNDNSNGVCLIYPYMKNGTLERRIRLEGEEILGVEQRCSILEGVAEGILFLHSQPKPLIHRDIKSSNILLDDDLMPKVR